MLTKYLIKLIDLIFFLSKKINCLTTMDQQQNIDEIKNLRKKILQAKNTVTDMERAIKKLEDKLNIILDDKVYLESLKDIISQEFLTFLTKEFVKQRGRKVTKSGEQIKVIHQKGCPQLLCEHHPGICLLCDDTTLVGRRCLYCIFQGKLDCYYIKNVGFDKSLGFVMKAYKAGLRDGFENKLLFNRPKSIGCHQAGFDLQLYTHYLLGFEVGINKRLLQKLKVGTS